MIPRSQMVALASGLAFLTAQMLDVAIFHRLRAGAFATDRKVAQDAADAGIGGLVSSPHEARMVRDIVGPKMAVVTPGVRPAGTAHGDQKRVMTPSDAIAAGSSHLVVARPIVKAEDPKAAALAILAEMDEALAKQA